ncbi:related to Patatin-like serine hydrolase [Ramularia collo-cygni]|uniref:Related to Patatin-like serine hydrolase n=1 Tax=Ramularia collo-cygni TaxID=112498 RepID=A0A2D3V964_9PEZI|nr:related to Patatin-like serine hydrolase [Ramularia collo-cygni]CZT24553.1 related to Patatin-like serine hydrolase [Ramularia collo-cygni]
MPKRPEGVTLPVAVVIIVYDIVHAWFTTLHKLFTTPRKETRLRNDLKSASNFAQWRSAAFALDSQRDVYNWRANPVDSSYDHLRLEERRQKLYRLRMNDDIVATAALLRTGFLRNLFGITKVSLYNKTYITTKESIRAYVEEMIAAIKFVADASPAMTSRAGRMTAQEKLELFENGQCMYGSTALVMEGGSVFGFCHIGVVKALFEHDILPRVIVGTATGALMAALVGIHTKDELPRFLGGDGIDLSAFAASRSRAREKRLAAQQSVLWSWLTTLSRRAGRLSTQGFVLDPGVLAECVEANVGDMTFQEAYDRTGRVLNIIVASPNDDVPNLLNHLTASNWLIRSAAMASHLTTLSRHDEIKLLKKTARGEIIAVPIRPCGLTGKNAGLPHSTGEDKTPLSRMRQQFNIDHFIVSQARPYVAPFITPSLPYVRGRDLGFWRFLRLPLLFIPWAARWIAACLGIFGMLPAFVRRIRSDQTFEADSLTLVPNISVRDLGWLLKNPTEKEIKFWITRGERSVWPALCCLKVRCCVEVALEQAHERMKRRSLNGAAVLFDYSSKPPPVHSLVINTSPFDQTSTKLRERRRTVDEGDDDSPTDA